MCEMIPSYFGKSQFLPSTGSQFQCIRVLLSRATSSLEILTRLLDLFTIAQDVFLISPLAEAKKDENENG